MSRFLLILCLILALLSGCVSQEAEISSPGILEIAGEAIPDFSSLEDCQAYADRLSRKYGIQILVDETVQAVTPWDYDLEPETQVPVLWRELTKLDKILAVYPEGLLQQASRQVGGLRLSVVRTIRGKQDLGGIETAAGLQYEEDGQLCIALTAGLPTPHTVYHELFHILEAVVLEKTEIYDDWQLLNPPDFTYDYDYVQQQDRRAADYLQPGTRAFIDSYAMSFPTEDRARLMEYAMTPGNNRLFDSPVMQEKLTVLSYGIRRAFSLEDPPGSLLWEQYLWKESLQALKKIAASS